MADIITSLDVTNIKTGVPVVSLLDAIRTALSQANANDSALLNELGRLEEILLDGQQGFVYDSFEAMREAFAGASGDYPSFALGDEIFIKDSDCPDFWISGTGILQGSLTSLPEAVDSVAIGVEYYVLINSIGYGITASKSRVIDMTQYEQIANRVANLTAYNNLSDTQKSSAYPAAAWVAALESQIEGIVAEGGEPNLIDSISLNGTIVSPDGEKVVALTDIARGNSLATDEIILGGGDYNIKSSGKSVETTLTDSDSKIPTSKAVKTWVEDSLEALEESIAGAGKVDSITVGTTTLTPDTNKNITIPLVTNLANAAAGSIPDAKAVADAIKVGVGNITIEELTSVYETKDITDISLTINGETKNYKGFVVEGTATTLAVFNNQGEELITQNFYIDNSLYVTMDASFTDATVYIRALNGNEVSGEGSAISESWLYFTVSKEWSVPATLEALAENQNSISWTLDDNLFYQGLGTLYTIVSTAITTTTGTFTSATHRWEPYAKKLTGSFISSNMGGSGTITYTFAYAPSTASNVTVI